MTTEIKARAIIKKEDGLTLIDMAVLLMVVGLMIAPFAHTYHIERKNRELNETVGSQNKLWEAVESFYFENGFYPCPSNPTLGPGDANFGQENRLAPIAPATQGLCATDVGNPDLPNPGDTVYWGAIPHSALKIDYNQTIDEHNFKLTYNVSAALTMQATYDSDAGQITTWEYLPDAQGACTEFGVDAPFITNRVHVVFVSHGEDGSGAYSLAGDQIRQCELDNQPAADNENCDRDDTFILPNCLKTDNVQTTNHYDDLIARDSVRTEAPARMWDGAPDPNNTVSNAGLIGVGNEDPQHEIDVIGNILSDDDENDPEKRGRVHSTIYCDTAGENCFRPSIIAGNDPRMLCEGSGGMGGIALGEARCQNTLPVEPAACPSGTFARGFDEQGNLLCE